MFERQVHALTVDVEDYFHVSAFSDTVTKSSWASRESRVVANTQHLMDLFEAHGVKATFFVLGWVAEHEPQLVPEIVRRGHEVACHGYSHDLVYNQSPELFKQETARSLGLLQDQSGQPIRGYRAASYSITESSLWALDILVDLGFQYDSSIFPVHHDRYGLIGGPETPHTIEVKQGQIVEFPITFTKKLGLRVPIAGGGYFRLYPLWLTLRLLREVAQQQPFVFYLHPWEIDPQQPKLEGSLLSRFRHYQNLGACEMRLNKLLQTFSFARMDEVLDGCDTRQVHRYS